MYWPKNVADVLRFCCLNILCFRINITSIFICWLLAAILISASQKDTNMASPYKQLSFFVIIHVSTMRTSLKCLYDTINGSFTDKHFLDVVYD